MLSNQAFLVTSPDNIFYLTGYPPNKVSGREALLLLSNHQNLFITDARVIQMARNIVSPRFTVVERSYKDSTINIITKFLQKQGKSILEFEKDNLTYEEFESYRNNLVGIKLVGVKNRIEDTRLLKSNAEIAKIKKAAQITDKTFQVILPLLKSGISEAEIVWKIKSIFHKMQADIAFEPIVASGAGSAIPHYQSTDKKIRDNELVLVDFGAKYQGYCSDMTRMAVIGKADTKTKHIYDAVLTAQEETLKQLSIKSTPIKSRSKKSGGARSRFAGQKSIQAKEIDTIARSMIVKAGFPSIPHGVGHGVGIAIHENPRINPKSDDLLKPKMVFTIEPGIYLPGWGGVRIEDLVYWGANGIEILSKSSKDLIEIL